jgi:glutathione synthase/RimK-type ligase-like ATP-grasp enzyme
VLASLPCRWVNHPSREAACNYKPWQLQVAAEIGLDPPRTLVTNDPAAARAFAERIGGPVVFKALAGGVRDDDGVSKGVPTSLVDPAEFDDSIGPCAHQFQEFVADKAYDARVTVVGERVFAVAIHASSDAARIDWRSDYAALTYEPIHVPDSVRSGVRALMRRFGLVFGALDFTVTYAGRWRFLEINANGQWSWIEQRTGLPIASAIADQLQHRDNERTTA